MSSKIFMGLVLSLSFVLSGCNLPLFEKPPESDPLRVELAGSTDCLSHVGPVLKLYFAGNANAPQLEATWNCMGKALETFEKSVKGRYEDRFTSRELARFLEEYFIEGETRIPDSLLLQVFLVKQLFVGGETKSITRTEIMNLRKVIETLRDLSLRLNPYIKVYNFGWTFNPQGARETQAQFFEKANMEMQGAAYELAALIARNGKPYKLESAVHLLKDLESFNEAKWTWLSEVEKAMPLIHHLKKSLAGGDPTEISPLEWQRFALLSGRGFIQYLRYYYFIKANKMEGNSALLIYLTRSIDDLFDYLGSMVAGKPGGKLTKEEILQMLQALTAFVPNLKVSDQLLVEMMKVKVVFFGGRVDWVQKDDFDKARSKLEAFRVLTERFLNYSDVYGLSWKGQNLSVEQRREHFRNAEKNLLEVSDQLGRIMENPYDLKDLVKLAEEFDQLYPSTRNTPLLNQMTRRFFPLLISVKNILFNDQGSIVGVASGGRLRERLSPSDQWSLFLKSVAEFYSRYSYYVYFLEKESLTEQPGLFDFEALVVDTSRYLEFLISRKPKGVIAFQELDEVLKALDSAEILPKNLKLSSIEGLLRVLMQKVLIEPAKRLQGVKPGGLTLEATTQLRSEFAIWAENQKILAANFRDVPMNEGKPGSVLLEEINTAPDAVGIRELKMILDGPLALSFDEMGRLYLSKPPLNYRFSTVTTINLVRAATRLMIRSYAMDLGRVDSYAGVNLEEANALYADIKPLAVDLELLSPESHTFAQDRFRDANLFTPVGNGDSEMNFREGSNLVMMILSGIQLDGMMLSTMETSCPIEKGNGPKDKWTADVLCVSQYYQKQMPEVFKSMPDLMKYQSSLSGEGFRSFFFNLLKAAGYVPKSDGSVRISDLSLYPHVAQYVESMYQVYDADRSGTLNTAEAMKAYPTYRQILKDVSGLKDEKQLKGLFTWMLDRGKPPQGPADQAKFIAIWVPKGEAGWKINSERAKVASILGFIADALSKPKPTPVQFWETVH